MFDYEKRLDKVMSQIPTERQNQVLEELERRVNHHDWDNNSNNSSNNALEPIVDASVNAIMFLGELTIDVIMLLGELAVTSAVLIIREIKNKNNKK